MIKAIIFLTVTNIICASIIEWHNTHTIQTYTGSTFFVKRKTDSLKLWNYRYTEKETKFNDTVKSPGWILFYRNKPVPDSAYFRIYHKSWSPSIRFYIFNISDSAWCKKAAFQTRIIANCVAPSVGGDYVTVGKYIFVNFDVCLSCVLYPSKIDYCRPVLGEIFGKVNEKKAYSMAEILSQFPINSVSAH